MLGVPDSLEESAQLDGAGHLTILFRIITPLILPTVAVVTLYYAVSHWNSWFNAMLFIKDRKQYPLQLILREVLILSDTDEDFTLSETVQFATIVVATVPVLTIYPFIQKYFVKGVMVGAVKG
jgi:putative aldouronate transport system permease protein